MLDERPLETLITHTRAELPEALHKIKEPIPEGYVEAFLEVQEKWKHSSELLERFSIHSRPCLV